MQHGGDTEDVILADFRHGRLDDALAVLQTAVPLEGLPAVGAGCVSSLGGREDLQVLTVRHQDDLRVRREGVSERRGGRLPMSDTELEDRPFEGVLLTESMSV